MSETWVWNDTIPIGSDKVVFDASDFVCDNVEYNEIRIGGTSIPGSFVGLFYDLTRVYSPDNGWFRNEYKTIIFATPQTGDLLTFLQANATKQSTGGVLA